MTKLIVALDGPNPHHLMFTLLRESGQELGFKIGPLTLLRDVRNYVRSEARVNPRAHVFWDAKFADHGPHVIEECVRRLVDDGHDAVSTATDEATETAVRVGGIKVWKHVAATSQDHVRPAVRRGVMRARDQGVDGVILPARFAREARDCGDLDVICPGVRMEGDDHDGHWESSPVHSVKSAGVTHVVIGRPIWNADDPVTAARRYLEALS